VEVDEAAVRGVPPVVADLHPEWQSTRRLCGACLR